MGGSNGGLLVGAVEEQRPDLFAVALPAVGVMDMLRYDQFTGGRAWATEYGSSTEPDAVPVPDQVLAAAQRQAGHVLSGDARHHRRSRRPRRAEPLVQVHRGAAGGAGRATKPVLIRVETQGSHGYRPTDKRIAELADEWAFAAAQMGMAIKSIP